ncbi:MAG: hypothetical protein OJF52_000526 [Nitrospira sp.]|jgi:hypothetical protein|nr:MAG: hypothetical protein OJF52_000526 [Nitrospira sp.]
MSNATTKRIGVIVAIATCALVVGVQSKSPINRPSHNSLNAEFTPELGVESAWPHLRQDFLY